MEEGEGDGAAHHRHRRALAEEAGEHDAAKEQLLDDRRSHHQQQGELPRRRVGGKDLLRELAQGLFGHREKREVARNRIWPTTNAEGAPRSTAIHAVNGGGRSDNVSRADSR